MGGEELPKAAYTVWNPGSDRELIELRRAGRSFEELAARFGRSVGAIKSRLRHLGMLDAQGKPEP